VIGLRAGNRGRPPLPPHYPAWITQAHESGGGALIDHSVHLTDLVRHLTGREVTSVAAETGAGVGIRIPGAREARGAGVGTGLVAARRVWGPVELEAVPARGSTAVERVPVAGAASRRGLRTRVDEESTSARRTSRKADASSLLLMAGTTTAKGGFWPAPANGPATALCRADHTETPALQRGPAEDQTSQRA